MVDGTCPVASECRGGQSHGHDVRGPRGQQRCIERRGPAFARGVEDRYARDGIELGRSTITDWVGQSGWLLRPLADAVGRYVLQADKIHGDDTPIRALGGKGEKAHTARLWVYVRDDRLSGDKTPPAVWFQYSANRKGQHPARHLKKFSGILQADAYSGYNALYERGRIIEAGC